MAREITTTGSKLVSTLMKEFNANFPYLRLKICPPESKALVAKGETILLEGLNDSYLKDFLPTFFVIFFLNNASNCHFCL